MPITRLNHAVLYVADLDRSVHFYTDVMGFRAIPMTPEGLRAAFLQAPGSINDHDLGLFGAAVAYVSTWRDDPLESIAAAVAEAVCFGIADRVYGEGVAAAVVLNGDATESDLMAHCRSSLADFKCPTTIYIIDSIPRTATGKIQRRNVAAAIAKSC